MIICSIDFEIPTYAYSSMQHAFRLKITIKCRAKTTFTKGCFTLNLQTSLSNVQGIGG